MALQGRHCCKREIALKTAKNNDVKTKTWFASHLRHRIVTNYSYNSLKEIQIIRGLPEFKGALREIGLKSMC